MGFNHDGLLPTIWGDLLECRMGSSEDTVGLHGSLILTMTGGTSYGSDHVGALTYIFEGDVFSPQLSDTPLDFDFQIPEAGGLLVRLPLASETASSTGSDDGQSIIYFQTLDNTLGFTASNGTFVCNFEENSCTNNDGRDNSTVSW